MSNANSQNAEIHSLESSSSSSLDPLIEKVNSLIVDHFFKNFDLQLHFIEEIYKYIDTLPENKAIEFFENCERLPFYKYWEIDFERCFMNSKFHSVCEWIINNNKIKDNDSLIRMILKIRLIKNLSSNINNFQHKSVLNPNAKEFIPSDISKFKTNLRANAPVFKPSNLTYVESIVPKLPFSPDSVSILNNGYIRIEKKINLEDDYFVNLILIYNNNWQLKSNTYKKCYDNNIWLSCNKLNSIEPDLFITLINNWYSNLF